MDSSMDDERRLALAAQMAEHLPVLRKWLHLSQQALGELVGLSRQSIVDFESKKRPLTWSVYLSLVLVFYTNRSGRELIGTLELFPADLVEYFNIPQNKKK